MADLVYRHNSITRFTHWMDAVALIILFMSGLQIFNAFPHLHWGSKAEPEEAFFSITATNDDGEIRGTTGVFGAKFDTTGVLGVQNTEMGPSPRGFPSWATIPGYFWLAGGRRWHFFFGWLFVLNGLLYFVFNFFNGHMRKFLFTSRDAAKVPAMILYYLHLRRESPQDSEYNPLQKMAYTGVFLILTPLVLLTGLAMSPQLNVAFHWLPAAFGGRQSARSIHFILAFAFLLFTFGHVFMVLTTGFINNMRSMVTGWCREKVAARIDLANKAAPVPAAPVSAAPAPALSLEQGEGDKKTKDEKEESEIPLTAESESSLQEERAADEKKEP
jgi:Ni/Fe-hydrogenase b-type cytochrome subunit